MEERLIPRLRNALEEEMKKRLAQWKPLKRELKGYLKRYARLVQSSNTGATFEE